MSPAEAGPAFFLAVVVILVVCRLVGMITVRLGQPPVIGEVMAGVLLGPSLLGLFWPDLHAAVFPEEIRSLLYVGGQIGLVIYMFGTGYELSMRHVRGSVRAVGAIALAGVVVPLALGVGVSMFGNSWANILKPGVSPLVSTAFIGVALAVTALPTMTRIINERGLAGTRFGALALACGALDDALAWILLAIVLGMHAGSAGPVTLAVGGGLLFVLLLWMVGRRLLGRVMGSGRISGEQRVLITAIALFAVSWFTDMIGLYAVFGAFCLGIAFPRGEAADAMLAKIMPVGQIVFLPLFFTYSGLNTKFTLLADPWLLLFTVLCLVAAVAGKFGACWATSRLVGEPQPIALRVGVLVNARGLMQLIALNIGLQAGIVSASLFTVLVVVALVTTVMTAPVLSWLDHRDDRRHSASTVDSMRTAAG